MMTGNAHDGTLSSQSTGGIYPSREDYDIH